jgi:hypothetical protein
MSLMLDGATVERAASQRGRHDAQVHGVLTEMALRGASWQNVHLASSSAGAVMQVGDA